MIVGLDPSSSFNPFAATDAALLAHHAWAVRRLRRPEAEPRVSAVSAVEIWAIDPQTQGREPPLHWNRTAIESKSRGSNPIGIDHQSNHYWVDCLRRGRFHRSIDLRLASAHMNERA